MEQRLVQMFCMGFAFATVIYFIISGLAWIMTTEGMDRESAVAFAERTHGKTWSEIMEEGHAGIENMNTLSKETANSEPTPGFTAAEMAQLTSMQAFRLIAAERSAVETPRCHNEACDFGCRAVCGIFFLQGDSELVQ